MVVAPPEKASRPPRQADDPDKYIRTVKGGRYQARPFDLGERFDLGIFETKAQARIAIREFWWGRRDSLPRHVKRVHTRSGERYHAAVRVFVGEFASREEAAEAVAKWVRATFPAAVAESLLGRPKE